MCYHGAEVSVRVCVVCECVCNTLVNKNFKKMKMFFVVRAARTKPKQNLKNERKFTFLFFLLFFTY